MVKTHPKRGHGILRFGQHEKRPRADLASATEASRLARLTATQLRPGLSRIEVGVDRHPLANRPEMPDAFAR